MMQIVYFSQKEQFLTEMETHEGEKVFITPSPAKADGLRSRLKSQQAFDVITIAKFTSNLVQALWSMDDRPAVKRKSELLLIFGILKNKYLPDLGYEQFTQAYNLFSDLRSFTLNEDALTSVLDEQPEIIKQAVQLFWKLLDATGFLDEHGAYQKIAEALRSAEENETLKKIYVFWGFQHLNGQQVDLLKALSIRYQVIIPFPLSLKDRIKKSDWISWLKDSRVSEVELEFKETSPKGHLLPINSREISSHLKNLLRAHDQIVLGVSKLSAEHIDIVPSQEVKFKIPHQILTPELREIGRELKNYNGTTTELQNILQEKIKTASSLKHFRALQLYLEALTSISDLTDEEVKVDQFFLKLLSEVVNLNQPRTAYVPVSSKEMTMDLKDMSTLEEIDRQRRVLLCIDDRFDDIQGLGQNYTESIQKALAALGPLKRNELELLFRQWEFRDLFSHAEVTVLMGEGTLKHSLIWKRLFQDIDLINITKNPTANSRVPKDYFSTLNKKAFNGSFSASKLQTFVDCPRKFYFNYVDKVFPNVLLEKDFDPMTSGTIIHEIIEKFFKENLSLDDLRPLTTRIMQVYIKEKKLELPREVYLQRELIFNHRALNGIQFIRELEARLGDKIEWKIEEPFKMEEKIALNGRIDCLGVGSKYLLLLDFKSTEFSASSNTDVANYEALQLWAYAHASEARIQNKTVIMGYVVLDDSSKSNLLTSDEEVAKEIKASKLCKIHRFKEDFSEKLKEAQEKMIALSLAIQAEKEFKALPRKTSTCDFCELNKVCVKSELTNV
ncbi:PD-(D/E)XK nuclease family protein [Peredibacter sp. HCB2-198]|uniref:PD-(D/E)XK nuclease family protein n=1 Tax=Peredibacter sp. HCB2-198 TaxID=3383025 RepID=UPI0038B66D7D